MTSSCCGKLNPHRHQLEQGILAIFSDILGDTPKDAHTAQLVADGIVTEVKAILANALNRLNHQALPQQRLPNELWCGIWDFLTADDCATVTKVCRDWRSTATNCSRLWRSLRYSTWRHGNAAASNLKLVSAFISRSGGLPLSLRIEINDSGHSTMRRVGALAEVIKPHLHRIQALEIFADHVEGANEFISHCAALPALESLEMVLGVEDVEEHDYFEEDWEWRTEMSLPALQSFIVVVKGDNFPRFYPEAFRAHYQNLRKLQAPFTQAEDLLSLLRACPNVKELILQIGEETLSPGQAARYEPEIRRLLVQAQPQSISIKRVFKNDWDTLSLLFARLDVPHLRLEYSGDDVKVIDELPALAFLSDVVDPSRLDFKTRADDFAFIEVASPSQGVTVDFRRPKTPHTTLDFPFLASTWKNLHLSARYSLTHVIFDCMMWSNVVAACPEEFQAIRSIELICHSLSIGTWLSWAGSAPPHLAHALGTFTVRSAPPRRVELDLPVVETIQALRRLLCLNPSQRLRCLRFEELRATGINTSPEAWNEIGDVVFT